MRDAYAVLRPSLNVSDEALVLSTHATLDAAMQEQRTQAKRYGWAYCEARKAKAPLVVGTFVSRRTHLVRDVAERNALTAGSATCGHCEQDVAEGESMHAVCRATSQGE